MYTLIIKINGIDYTNRDESMDAIAIAAFKQGVKEKLKHLEFEMNQQGVEIEVDLISAEVRITNVSPQLKSKIEQALSQ